MIHIDTIAMTTTTAFDLAELTSLFTMAPVRCPVCDDRGCRFCNYGRGY